MEGLSEKDAKIFNDYLIAYKECFEAMNDLLQSVLPRVTLTEEEIRLGRIADMKRKNMVYHIRKWFPNHPSDKG